MTRGGAGGVLMEAAVALAIAACFAAWAARIQMRMPVSYLGTDDYWPMAQQFANGERPHWEVPFVYRIGVPWLVSRIAPFDVARGFFLVNLVFGLAVAPLLTVWARLFIPRVAARLVIVLVYAATWLNPVRYVFFDPIYVDPAFLALTLVGLWLVFTLRTRRSAAAFVLLTLTCVAGTLVRETMLMVPIAFLFVDNPLPLLSRADDTRWRPRVWERVLPLAASIATIAFIHTVADAEGTRSYGGAALQWLRKPPTSYLLSWVTTYGPLLAVVVYDWRRAARFLADRQPLLVFLLVGAALAYLGGADTERLLSWSMPVVYVLIGLSLSRHWAALAYAPLAVALAVCQAVSARVFWPVPDLRLDASSFAAPATLWERIYGVLNRLFVIDHFYGNLMASYGSPAFRLIRLAVYLAAIAGFVWALRWRSLALGGAASGPEAAV